MENTSKLPPVSDRDLFYYRQRSKNRLFEAITAFYAEEAESREINKKDVADCLKRDPSQITRWLSGPSNLTNDSISDLLLSLGAEMDYRIVRFRDRSRANEMHPLIQRTMPRDVVPSGVPPEAIKTKSSGTTQGELKIIRTEPVLP